MHGSFAGIVAEDAVDHYFLLVLVEPPVFAAQDAFGLRWGGGHPESGDEPDYAGNQALEGEEVAPAATAVGIANVQEAEGEEGTDDGGALVGNPEVAEADRQFF